MVYIEWFVFTGLNDVLDQLGRRGSNVQTSSGRETSDTSGDESGPSSGGRRKAVRKKYVLKRSHAASELASLFVTGSSDAGAKPGSFYCRICCRDISIAGKGAFEIRRHFPKPQTFWA